MTTIGNRPTRRRSEFRAGDTVWHTATGQHRLGLSPSTVANYDHTRRLRVRTTADTVLYAYATQLVHPQGQHP
ncbi:MAG: hypothetical protein ACRDQ5_22475 [Sciscionella sp.]